MADLVADYGAEIVAILQPGAEQVAGLIFCGERVQWRRIAQWVTAAGIALGGDVPRELFEAIGETPEEAERYYNRYMAHVRAAHATRAAGTAI